MQPSGHLLAMGASNGPGQGLQGAGPPVALGYGNLAVMDLICEQADVFIDPVFLLPDHVIHDVDLIAKLPKH